VTQKFLAFLHVRRGGWGELEWVRERAVGYMYVQGLRVCDERLLGFMLINDLAVRNGTILVYIASFWYRLHQCTKFIYKQEFRSGFAIEIS